jgi:hypothetical protein
MGDQAYDEREFEIIKRSQLAKLSSYYVLQAAVRKPTVAALPVFQNQPDPVAWLQEHLEVDFPGDGEIMAIRLRGPESHSNDLVFIVDEVTRAYEDEVIFADTQTRLNTRDLTAQSLKRLKEELIEKMQVLNDIKKEIGTAATDSPEIHARQMEVDVLSELAREISRRLELCDFEANAPSRIRKLQPAVASRSRQLALPAPAGAFSCRSLPVLLSFAAHIRAGDPLGRGYQPESSARSNSVVTETLP